MLDRASTLIVSGALTAFFACKGEILPPAPFGLLPGDTEQGDQKTHGDVGRGDPGANNPGDATRDRGDARGDAGGDSAGSVVIYRDSFDSPDLSPYAVEIEAGNVSITGGSMDIDAAGGCTIWLRQKLQGPLRITFAVTVIDKGGANDRVSDMNCFWMARDLDNPDDLFARTRSGDFSEYHYLSLYYVGMGGNSNSTTRFRRYPGGGDRPLDPEHD
jgi:hypothetical protein